MFNNVWIKKQQPRDVNTGEMRTELFNHTHQNQHLHLQVLKISYNLILIRFIEHKSQDYV